MRLRLLDMKKNYFEKLVKYISNVYGLQFDEIIHGEKDKMSGENSERTG